MLLSGLEAKPPVYTRIIHHLSFLKNQWVLFTEQCDENVIEHQTLYTKNVKAGEYTPADMIKNLWKDKGRIRQVSFGQSKWIVVADVTPENTNRWLQHFSFTKIFPREEINDAWSVGQRISYLSYCDNLWVLITEKNKDRGLSGQKLVLRNALPTDDINQFWEEGSRIAIMAYGDGQWVLVGEKKYGEDTLQTQTFFYNTDFPSEKIDEYYNTNRRIHTISYASKEKLWAIISDTKARTTGQSMFSSPSFPDAELKRLNFGSI